MTDIQDNQQDQPKQENATSLQDFAKLMGLSSADLVSDEHRAAAAEQEQPAAAETNDDAGHDVFDDEEFNPEKNRTKVSLQNSGVAKAAVVGGASLAVILGGTMLFQSQLPKEQVAQAPKKKDKDPVDEKVANSQAALNKAQQSESETKAQLALAKQKDSLAQAQQPAGAKAADKSKSSANNGAIEQKVDPQAEVKVAVAKTAEPAPIMVASAPKTSRTNNNVAAAPVAAPVVQLAAREVTRSARNQSAPLLAAAQPPVNLFGVTKPQAVAQKSDQKPTLKPLATPGLGTPLASNLSPTRATNSPLAARPLATAALPKTVDMNAELQQLASAGRYGVVTTAAETPAANTPASTMARNTIPTNGVMNSNLPPLSQYFQRYATAETGTSPVASSSNSFTGARTAFANSQEIMRGGNKSDGKEESAAKENVVNSTVGETPALIRTLLVGTSAKGSAVTPVLWGGGANSTARFLLKLDEPMLDGNNRVAFPVDTQFVVTAKPASTNIGLAELEVVSVIIKGMEFAPPTGSIVIRNDQGGLLIGEDYFRRDEQIANRDFNTVLAGALGNVGRILNQPISSYSSTVAVGIPSNTNVVTNRDPNILGAVLEGGFRDISTVWSQRNQQEIQALASKPNVYQIPKGRGVRVFVNQSMTF
jgi:Bacterial conjugation TrbI-like protein